MDFRNSSAMLGIFSVVSAGLVALYIFAFVPGALGAWAARAYVAVPGVVTRFDVVPGTPGRSGTPWRATVEYRYEVSGTTFSGSRLTVSDDDLGGRVRWFAARYPVGAAATVWHSPRDPQLAVLDPRLPSFVVTWLLAGLMFLGAALTFWADAADALMWRASKRPAGGVFLRRTAERLYVRLPRYSPVMAGANFIFGCGMATMLGWLVWVSLRDEPFTPAWHAWAAAGLVVLPGVFAYAWSRHAAFSGRRDLVLNEAAGLISLPPTFGRRGVTILPIARVEDITVEIREHQSRTQYGTATTYTHLPTIIWKPEGGRRRAEPLAEWTDSGKAFAFAKWLRARLITSDLARGDKGGRSAPGRKSVLAGLYDD